MSDRYESTRAALYQGLLLDNGQYRPNGFGARRAAVKGFRDMPTGLSEEHDGARRDAGGPPFSQPPPYVAEISLQVVDEQRWLTRIGYHSRVVRVENQIDVVGRRRHVVDIDRIGRDNSFLSDPRQSACNDKWIWMFGGHCEHPTKQIDRGGFHKVRKEIKYF